MQRRTDLAGTTQEVLDYYLAAVGGRGLGGILEDFDENS